MEVLSRARNTARRARRARPRVALLGCTHCGQLLEGENEQKVGHLTGESCPECSYAMRVVDLAEAQQLTRERFLAAHWQEIAATKNAVLERSEALGSDFGGGAGAQRHLPSGFRRPLLQRDEFDSDARQLRENLRTLSTLLEDCDAQVRRRILLMFGELVAHWQDRFAGEPISVVIEVLSGSVRLSARNSYRHVTPAQWNVLMSGAVADLVDAWGIDRRLEGRAWFEFRGSPKMPGDTPDPEATPVSATPPDCSTSECQRRESSRARASYSASPAASRASAGLE